MKIMKGYLTFTMAAFAVLGGIGGYFLGFIDGETATVMIWSGLSIFGIRRAMK